MKGIGTVTPTCTCIDKWCRTEQIAFYRQQPETLKPIPWDFDVEAEYSRFKWGSVFIVALVIVALVVLAVIVE